jgi:hypothetical protein
MFLRVSRSASAMFEINITTQVASSRGLSAAGRHLDKIRPLIASWGLLLRWDPHRPGTSCNPQLLRLIPFLP